jgi:hypothetical protein
MNPLCRRIAFVIPHLPGAPSRNTSLTKIADNQEKRNRFHWPRPLKTPYAIRITVPSCLKQA